eukprot:2705157-Rhodomonas_salina.1
MCHAHVKKLFDRKISTLGEKRSRIVEETIRVTNWKCTKAPGKLQLYLGCRAVAAVAVVVHSFAQSARQVDVPVCLIDVVGGDQ